VKDTVEVMGEQLTSAKRELEKELIDQSIRASIRASIDIENIILDSVGAVLETWAIDEFAKSRADRRRDSIRNTVQRMADERAQIAVAEALKNPAKAMAELELSERFTKGAREATLRSDQRRGVRKRERPPAKLKSDPPTDQ
jgi:hypothetical protein